MALDKLLESVATEIETKVTSNIETKLTDSMNTKMTELDQKLETALAGADLNVTVASKPTVKLGGNKHKNLAQLIKIAANRLPVLLVGMAGTGKTHAAEQVAEALDLDFFAMSVGAQTSKSDLMGFIHAGGQYVPSMFRRAFEDGGIFLLDEIDAGNSNVLVQLNAALSNGYCAFPDRMVAKHEDFVFMASANTYGQGASRQYVGRNQLDAATLDRFVILDWDIDERLEANLIGSEASSVKWLAAVRKVRKYVDSEGIRALVSPRATLKGAKMLQAGLTFDQTIQAAILGGVSVDKQKFIKTIAKDEYDSTSVKAETKGEAKSEVKASGEYKFEPKTLHVGDKVKVHKPKDPSEHPGWNGFHMNVFEGITSEVTRETPSGNYELKSGNRFSFNSKWLELVERAK